MTVFRVVWSGYSISFTAFNRGIRMKASFVVTGLSSALAMAQGMSPAPATTVVVPSSARLLLSWTPGEVRCDGMTIGASSVRRPWNQLVSRNIDRVKPATYRFGIDASGRPLSIVRDGEDFTPFAQDIAPALAASRFAPGADRKNCSITYSPNRQALSATPIEDLVSYSITPTSGPLPKEGWDRIRALGTCADAPRPQPLIRAFPNFREVASTPGVKDWSLVGYDTDASGRPVKLRIVHTTGNAAMDKASLKAVGDSRFTDGARTGCLYPYWRAPAKLAPPPVPAKDAFRPQDSTCAGRTEWAVAPTLRFPDSYRRRAIEGWAIVTYDLAPWGETGNVKVAASEPTEDFGKQAIAILRSARATPSAQGGSGCVETVRFDMGRSDAVPVDPEASPEIF